MEDKQQIVYIPQGGVCSKKLLIDIEDNRITDLRVERGCEGNAQGISALIKGMSVDEAISRLEGICCGSKTTSCPDQIAQALKTYQSEL
ncbi:uncharacterized protein (TIGR03905 family) [Parabacteroides sp. PFB2-10]|uniref:TIGR03905 family TSCPD domain-containing protein n=1 Tax=Parabacteroides sp. PFB2-10 TaxID=1742405 RepID=UPI002473C34E|nr:TIGR03905 family TSCPD domain-containing protein [Parabacteroides sp. PFB2-10]MDH6312119.1 uncharacterized protein (TIGR03905 family) [Parabacteroides sp. PFB2-10]MDL2244607.1 TIGR03905 family TSCPD domain-containing protein [Parabacteroides sp. OttesenSCG-928-J18]